MQRELKPTIMAVLPGAFRQLYRKYITVQEQWSWAYRKLFVWAWRRKRLLAVQREQASHGGLSHESLGLTPLLDRLLALLIPQIDVLLGGRLRYIIVCDRDMPIDVRDFL